MKVSTERDLSLDGEGERVRGTGPGFSVVFQTTSVEAHTRATQQESRIREHVLCAAEAIRAILEERSE